MIIKKNSDVICRNAKIANNFLSRLKGLLGRNEFGDIDGLMLSSCRQIHSIGMKFNFDALYLDSEYKIIAIYENIGKNKILPYNVAVSNVLELPKGMVQDKNLGIGDVLKIS